MDAKKLHPSSAPRLQSLDILRSLAILLVFLSHYGIFGSNTLFRSVGQFGWAGVDLFFVLSGYLIASQLLKPLTQGRQPSYREFYFRRALRILPSYFAVLLLYWTFPHWREREVMAPFWKFLTFTANFGMDFKHAGAFSHAWSLCVEEHFYLLLPVFVIAFSRPKTRKWVAPFMVSILLAGIAIRAWSWLHFLSPLQGEHHALEWYITYFKTIYYPSYNRLDGLLAGVGIALVYRFRPELWKKVTARGNLILLLGLTCLAGACTLCYEETSFGAAAFGYPLLAIGFGSLLIAALSPKSLLARIRIPGASQLAVLSYTFYLTHKEVIHLIHRRVTALGWDHDNLLIFIATFVISLAASMILNALVERPFLALRDELTERVPQENRLADLHIY